METKDLAEFYKVTRQSIEKWTPEKRKQKTVQALANAEQPIVDLIADISKLVFIFNCKWIRGDVQVKAQRIELDHNYIMVDGTEFWDSVSMHDSELLYRLQSIKNQMVELVYGL